MFRVIYVKENAVLHKGGFETIKEAMKWAENQTGIIIINLLVWNDHINCYSKILY